MRKTPAPTGPRDRMIEAAITLMRRSGLSGAGINEIVRESGAPKGSVYHFFPDGKQQIAADALSVNARRVLDFIGASLAARAEPGDKVKALFNAFARRLEEGDFRHSCAAGTVCLDLERDLEGLRIAIATSFSGWVELIAGHFTFRDARRARSFAGLVVTAIEGAYIRGRAERSSRAFREAGLWLAELAERESRA
jgi:TetR/AcrR family transcriptional regulator, lmrAB and yxaGH operons repressor